MKKFVRLLAVILLVAMLSGCSLVTVNPEKVVVATVGEETITKADFDAYLNAYLSGYGYTIESPEIAERLPEIKASIIDVLVEEKVLDMKIKELGLDQITEEDKAKAVQDVQDWYDMQLEMLIEAYTANGAEGDPATEAAAALDSYLMDQMGYDLEGLKAAEIEIIPTTRLYEYATKDVVVSEEEAKILYAENVANAKNTYDADIATFVAHHDSGYVLYYIPEGLFYVKHILIGFTEEQKTELQKVRYDDDEAIAATADAKRDEFLATIQEEADAVLAQVEAGGDFDALIVEYGDDPGMADALYNDGYLTYIANPGFVPEFTAACDLLTADGMTSGLVASDFGYHIIRRVSTMPAGEVPFADVEEDVMAGMLSEKQDEAYAAAVAAWIEEAQVEINDKKL